MESKIKYMQQLIHLHFKGYKSAQTLVHTDYYIYFVMCFSDQS